MIALSLLKKLFDLSVILVLPIAVHGNGVFRGGTAHNSVSHAARATAPLGRVLGPARRRWLRPAKRELGFAGLASRFGHILACVEDAAIQNVV